MRVIAKFFLMGIICCIYAADTKTYAGIKLGDKIDNYTAYYGGISSDIRGQVKNYKYAGFVGELIASKNGLIDQIKLSKDFDTKEELNKIEESFNTKYKFLQKIESVEFNYIKNKKYPQTIYLYDDEGVQIKLIEDNLSDPLNFTVSVKLEYISKSRNIEIKKEKEKDKAKLENDQKIRQKETSGL